MRTWMIGVGLFIFSVVAQCQTAEISGRVTDRSGGVIPDVSVTLTNADTGTVRGAVTNRLGYYTLPLLLPGNYKVNLAKSGFGPQDRTAIVLQVDQHLKLDFIMQVGTLSQEISVTAAEPLLDTVEPGVGQVIENRQITEMPLNGRNYVTLGLLSGGTADPAAGARYQGFSSGGQRVAANNYLLDGADNNSYEIAGAQGMIGQAAGAMVSPSIDAIQEFKVQTNSYSAEYGRGTGAVINATIKSGTNQLHGAAYEFLRNDAVDAKNFFASPTAPTPQYQRNQYGVAAGGPIVKNKTFLFGAWEQTNIRTAQSTVDSVPTSAERTGDFAQETKAIVNPLSPGMVFPGNIIPSNLIDPVALKLINLYPAAQNSLLASNYLYNGPKDEDDRRVDVRLDHTFRERDSAFLRVSNYYVTAPGALALPAPAFGADAPDQQIAGWAAALSWNHTFTSSLVAITRLSWSDNQFERSNPAVGGSANFNQKYGIPGGNDSLPGGFAGFNFTGYTHLGLGAYNPGGWGSQTRQAMTDFNWSHGAQNIKFGVNVLRIQDNVSQVGNEEGAWTFNGQFSGDAMADFLLGWSSQWLGSNAEMVHLRGWLPAAYVQDDWKLSPKLTLNLGMRYEISFPYYDTQNRLANFVMDSGPAHLVLASDHAGYGGRSLVNANTDGWEPRAGLALQISPKTVIRSGFGIYRTYFEPMGDSQFLGFSPPFVLATTISASKTAPALLLSVGPPAGTVSLARANGLTFSSYPTNPSRAYAPQWNFNIQQQFAGKWVVEIGYMGERGVHLIRWTDGNFAPAEPGNINANRPIQTAVIPPSGVVASPLGPVNQYLFNGNSNYQSMVVKLARPLTTDLTLLTSYTWSKTMGDVCGEASDGNATNCGYQDPLNMRAEKALDVQNMGQRFVTSLLYTIPFGRRQRFGAQIPRAIDLLAGGWELGGLFTWHTGLPYSIADSGNPANTGSLAVVNRPNVIGNPLSMPWSVAEAFNTSAFAIQPAYTYGSLGRNTMLLHPISNLDLIVSKVFTLTDRVRLQARFEAFNATNTPPFTSAPNATVGTNGFGQIQAAGPARELQFALKLLF
jgi:hypothetical protein